MEIYILQMKSVFLLSLWKTYVGPALSVPYGFSYFEMLLFNVSAAMVSGYVTMRLGDHIGNNINALLGRLLPKRKRRPEFKPQLRKFLRLWRRYSFYGAMALTPVLIGIPMGVYVSARLGTGKTRIMVTLFVLCLFWASLSCFAALSGINLVDI